MPLRALVLNVPGDKYAGEVQEGMENTDRTFQNWKGMMQWFAKH